MKNRGYLIYVGRVHQKEKEGMVYCELRLRVHANEMKKLCYGVGKKEENFFRAEREYCTW
jgi:hypothetical protein